MQAEVARRTRATEEFVQAAPSPLLGARLPPLACRKLCSLFSWLPRSSLS